MLSIIARAAIASSIRVVVLMVQGLRLACPGPGRVINTEQSVCRCMVTQIIVRG